MGNTLVVKGKPISFYSQRKDDYISLTDIAKYKDKHKAGPIVANWMRIRYTIEFIGLWEQIYIKNRSGSNTFILSSKEWIKKHSLKSL